MEEDPYLKLVQGNLQKLDKQKVSEKVGRDLLHNGNGLQSAIAAELAQREELEAAAAAEAEAAALTEVTLR